MKNSDLKCIAITIIITIVTAALIILKTLSVANAATAYTKQPGEYFKYKLPYATLTYKYSETTSLEVPLNWVKQAGVYNQYKSLAGATKYELVSIVMPVPLTPPADAINCAAENESCSIPAGIKAHVWYGIDDRWVLKENIIGVIECSNIAFGKDPAISVGKKCFYKNSAILIENNPPFIGTGTLNFIGQYVYHKEWGEIIYPKENTVMKCPAFKIMDGKAIPFDAVIMVNGVPTCP